MKSRLHSLDPQFQFASFTFPKYVFTLPPKSQAKRLENYRKQVTGDYFHAPAPIMGRQSDRAHGFYLESDGMPRLRWQWCDEVKGARINHRGWYSDDFGDNDLIRGVVFRLPKSRGYLIGWSMGEGMASCLEYDIFDDEQDAARSADRLAEIVAEREREYQEEERAKQQEAERKEIEDFANEID